MIARRECQTQEQTMPRYQELSETQMDDAQRRIFNDCKAGPRGAVPPPVHVWLNSPGLADNTHKLGAHVRFGTQFTPRQTEIAILMTARYWTAQFEWAAHVRLALQAGLPQEVIDAIAERRTASFSDPGEQLVYDFCRDYYDDHRVDDATYQRVVARFGDRGIVDLAGLIGYYSFVSVTLNVFEVPTPSGAKLLEK
jgi:4-carboxymuconolactone decarboxylase